MKNIFFSLLARIKFSLLIVNKVFKSFVNKAYHFLSPLFFFFKFLFHRYDHQQFDPRLMKNNLLLLSGAQKSRKWFTSTKEGKLLVLEGKNKKRSWLFKNALLLGALRSRLNKVIYLSFLTFLIELTNPFDKDKLRWVVSRKLQLVKRLLPDIYRVNDRLFDLQKIEEEMKIYEMRSFLQYKVIKAVIEATSQSKELESVKEARLALKKGLYPILITEGSSGAYWMRNTQREIIGLFKPFDEEIHAPNNPVGPKFQGALGERKTRRGIKVGEALHREVAAYVVDQLLGFGIVPHTGYAIFTHHTFFDSRENLYRSRRSKTKYGSFQEFVAGFQTIHKLSSEERKSIPIDEFQLLVLLDIIIGNTDRNAGNFLVSEGKVAAVDHGLSFPDVHDYYSTWYWKHLEVGQEPFLNSIIALLENFPFQKLFWKLKKHCFIEYASLQRMKERVVFFHEAVKAGLNSPELLAPLIEDPHTLIPLTDLEDTLRPAAAKIVQSFL